MGATRRVKKRINRALFVLAEISDDLPPEVKDALAIRNTADVSGVCRCGARACYRDGTPVDYGALSAGYTDVFFLHESDCPAGDERLLERQQAAQVESYMRSVASQPLRRRATAEVDAKVLTAIHRACQQRTAPACEHVVRQRALATLCVQCPTVGFLCPACSARHMLGHDHRLEFECDRCGGQGTRMSPITYPLIPLSGGRVRDGGGHSRPFDGPVWLLAVGVCGECSEVMSRGGAA